MSNQLQITGDLKVKSLTGALTATAGVVSSVPLGTANGVATLGTDGKVPSAQLPTLGSSYKGTWNAATNTPYIVDGVGTSGDYYLVSTGGTWNGIVFVEGNTVIYSGTIWQRAGGGTGTVTSVGLSAPAAFSITGSPITGAGTLAIAGAGTANDYIKGDGTLGLFSTAAVASITGGASTIATSNLTASRALNSDASGKVVVSTTTSTELGYLTGVTSSVQTQLNSKQVGLNGTGFIKATGTTISYDNTSYLPLGGGTLTGNLNYSVGNGVDWYINVLTSNGATFRLKSHSGSAGYNNRSGALAWIDGAGTRADVLGWTDTTIIAYQPLSGTSALFSSTISASNFSGTSSGTNTGDQTLAGLGGQPQLNGTGFVKASGTSISYDNSTYLSLSGGILTGALNGTSATFSASGQSLQLTSASDVYLNVTRGSSILNIGIDATGSFYNTNTSHRFLVNNGTITALSIASTGAATFSGLVTNYNVYNTQTASYTLVLADASKIVEMNVGSANTVTIPNNSSVAFPIGTEITVLQYGGGVTSIAVAGGVSIVSKDNANIIANRYSGVTLIKRATNEWYLIGNIVI